MKKQELDAKTIQDIVDNYKGNEKALVQQLHFETTHGPVMGGFREDIWRGMFEQIVPKKFVIEQSVFILDSEGHVSNEIDLAIFDETYTPYIFRYGRLKFLPIEAVAVAVECKSNSMNQKKLNAWAKNVANLKTSTHSYTRTIGFIADGRNKPVVTQSATRPIRILCCLNENIVNRTLASGEALFDMVIRSPSKDELLKIEIDKKRETLQDWYIALNHADTEPEKFKAKTGNGDFTGKCIENIKLADYEVTSLGEKVNLLTLNLQLNQLLMLINNPMLFPHIAYAEMFNALGKGDARDD